MFSRMKQKVKEKTGRAKATSLPDDIEVVLPYYKSLQGRVKDLHKHLNDINDYFKIQKKVNFGAPLANLTRLGDKVNVAPFAEAVEKRINAETEAAKKVNAEIEKFKAYAQCECKVQQEHISMLNKTRLDMDVANGNYSSNDSEANKARAESATREFEAACARIREMVPTIKDHEANHSAWVENVTKELKMAFKN